jgi:mannobiose 2-epimerase
LNGFSEAVSRELTTGLLPYWLAHTPDERHGGFVGRITHDGLLVPDAPKGAVLNARILWAFAAAARVLGGAEHVHTAERAFRYLEDHFWDPEHGGIFWMVDHAGRPLETKKQVYAQAFAVYALAEHFRLTGREPVLGRAVHLFEILEAHALDARRGWRLISWTERGEWTAMTCAC